MQNDERKWFILSFLQRKETKFEYLHNIIRM